MWICLSSTREALLVLVLVKVDILTPIRLCDVYEIRCYCYVNVLII